MKRVKLLTAVLLIATLLLSICPQAFAASFRWITYGPIVCNMVYEYSEHGIIVNDTDRNMGIIGTDGNMKIPFSKGYKELSFVDYSSGYIAFVDSSDRGGVMDVNGNIVVNPGLYDRVIQRVDDYVYIVAKKGDQEYYGYEQLDYALGDAYGNIIIPYGMYQRMELDGWYGTVKVYNENYNCGVYSSAGQPIIPVEYGYEEVYATGSPYRYVGYINGTWYLLDNAAQTLTAFEGYIHNNYEIEDYIVAGEYSSKKIYDLNGNLVGELGDSKELVKGKFIEDRYEQTVYDLAGNVIIPSGKYFDYRLIDENYYSVSDINGQCTLMDVAGNMMMPYGIISSIYDFYEIHDGKYIIAGKEIIDIYGNVLAQSDDYNIYYMGNGHFFTQEYSFDEYNYTYTCNIKMGRVDGELLKPEKVDSSIKVTVNGTPVQFTDQPPVIVDGRTLLPLRAIFDLLGANIEWEAASQTVYANRNGVWVTLTIGASEIWVDGQPIPLEVRAQIMNGRTMVPVRAVADAFGCGIGWDAATSTVIITTN